MREYRFNEGDLQIPDAWHDTSITAFVAVGTDRGSASFVITRDMEAPDLDLQAYADQQLVKAAQQLPSYRLIMRVSTTVDQKPALQSDFTWLSPETVPIRQRQICLRHGRTVLVITLTARETQFGDYEVAWVDVLNSLRLVPRDGEDRT